MVFDVNSARKSGYSDAEIAGFLAEQNKLDLESARKAGYRDHEIIGHFTGTEVRPADAEFMAAPTANVSPENDPSKMAGMGTQAIASLPTDMKARAGYFAKQRFPDDPNAISRYGVQDGRLFYTDDEGKMYFEEPKLSTSPTEVAKYAASTAGHALPLAGSIGGGIIDAPGGGIPGAAVGAAAGDEMRQLLAAGLVGDTGFSLLQTAKEAGGAALGQGLGVGFGKMLNRGVPRDINLLDNPEIQAGVAKLQSDSEKLGISLTPGETTNLRSLRSQQNYLGDTSRSADIMGDFYNRRNTVEVPAAAQRMLSEISPVESVEVGAKSLQKGATETIESARKTRIEESAPLYKDVYPKRISPNLLTNIAEGNNIISNAIKDARRDEVTQYYINKYQQETGKEIADNSVGFLDAVKQSLDGKAQAAERAGDMKSAKAYGDSAAQLRTKIDSMVPKYAEARAAYAGESPAVDALAKGEVGLVKDAGQTNLDRIPKLIFESGPDAVKANRVAYVKAGKEQEWNDGLRSYLQSNFDKASKEFKTGNVNPGASFRASVFGTAKQKAAMQNAMSTEQWAGFNRLMDVLEASGRVTVGGSRTHFAGEMEKEMSSQAMGISGKVAQNVLDAPGIPRRLGQWVKEMKAGNYNENIANIITSPKAMEDLKALKYYKPGSIKAMALVSQVLAQYGFSEAGDPSDVPAGALSNQK